MSFWAKNNAKKISKYIKNNQDKPGILAIHNLKNESIIVFYDEDKIKEDIYSEYQGVEIDLFNVRYVLANSVFMLKKYSSADNSGEKGVIDFLTDSIKLSKELLNG
jgi:hypothetical protein